MMATHASNSYTIVLPIRMGYVSAIIFPQGLAEHKKVLIQGPSKKITRLLDEQSKISSETLQKICLSIDRVCQQMVRDKTFAENVQNGLFGGFIHLTSCVNPPEPISAELGALVHRLIQAYEDNPVMIN